MSGPPRLRLTLAAFVAALMVLGLALPAAALAVERTLTINYAGEGEGVVSCKAGSGPIEECEPEYPSGTALTLFAEPEEGSVFGGFSAGGGSAACSTSPCAFTLNANSSVTATFNVEQFKLKVKIVGEGSVECITGGPLEPCEAEYPSGTELTLVAEAEEESELVEWKVEGSEFGAGTDCEEPEEAECELTLEEDTTVKAIFALQPLLGIEIKGSGSGSVECEVTIGREECSDRYPKGTELILYAEADPAAEFAGWSGACSGKEECELTMEGPRTVAANFESTVKYTLTIDETGPGMVSSSPGSIHCPSACSADFRVGTKVTLTATPAAGSLFDGWAGGGCKGIGTCTLTVSGDMTVAAEFEPKPPPEVEEEPLEAGIAKAAATAQVKAGKAALKLSCSGGPCDGTLQLAAKVKQGHKLKSLVAGRAPFHLAAGAKKTIEVKLSAPVKQELAKGKSVKAKLSGAGVASATVTLVPAKTHKSH
jgi:hypothetical protein